MQTYTAPLRDMRFVIHELHGDNTLSDGPDEVTPDIIDSILDEAAKFVSSVLLPLNSLGDAEGCHYIDGTVRTPRGFVEAYSAYAAGGYASLDADPAHGGQGLPVSVRKLVEEMICSCNVAFSMYPGLSQGAYLTIRRCATHQLQELYLPKLVDGSWSGTMCLTEAQCGTDLGLVRTQAIPQSDGTFRIAGSKIFITSGEHDLTENIIHLVLARLPDAPAGVKGLSLFLVPKFLPKADCTVGLRNAVRCAGIEHKMGIKASATCQLEFDQATGWLIGEPHKGMRAMFVMMNSERLSVGIQGLGLGEVAYQSAATYARERLQGRSLQGPVRPEKAADPIIVHPDVRRMLMTMRAYNEGCRALGIWVANAIDRIEHAKEPEDRLSAEEFVGLMTPVVKALFTDLGFETTNLALQVYGGHGYIADHGMEQLVRDARIAMIYEGTNGVQALDLVTRKLPANRGRSLRHFFHPVSQFVAAHHEDPDIGAMVRSFAKAFGALQLATSFVAQSSLKDAEEAAAAASEYLRLFGLVALGFMWLRMAKIASNKLGATELDREFYGAKLATASYYVERILPQAGALLQSIKAGKRSIMAIQDKVF